MSHTKRVLIVGGVAGGASAAARLRRLDEHAEIIIFERGEHVSFANCGLPYHIGGMIADRSRLLVQTPAALKKNMNIEARTRSQVVQIDRENKQIKVRDLSANKEYSETYDYLILSPGAEPFKPAIAGADLPHIYTLRSISDMDVIKKQIDEDKARRAVIVGGGYIGLEMAEALAERGVKTALVEVNPQVMNTMDPEMAAPLHQELRLHGIDLHLGSSLTEIQPGLKAVLSSGTTIETDLVLLAIGVRPDAALARQAGLQVGSRGGIVVNAQMQTSDPYIYAVGDAVEIEDFVTGQQTVIPLAGPANRQGRIAADNICGVKSSYRGTQGTAICKIFNLAAAVTGMNEKTLKRQGMPYEKVYVHPFSHAGYYPGAVPISLKLLFDRGSGRILGAQAVGAGGVDKRIDVIATAMRAGLTVHDLKDLELSYAPPYGSAKDPVNYAGFVAANAISGDMPIIHHDALEGRVLLDVRTPAEAQAGTIPGSINVPLDQLRSRLSELPKDKEIAAFCQVGLRGYLACRILNQSGFRSSNLSGGYKTWSAAKAIRAAQTPAGRQGMNEAKSKQNDVKNVSADARILRRIDACGLQCPGPILRLKQAVDEIQTGQAVQITTTDPGFAADIKGWCSSTGSTLHSLTLGKGQYEAVIVKGALEPAPKAAASKNKTLVVFSGDFDKAMAAFIIANGAASMGGKVTMFFTFWGLNLLRKPVSAPVDKTFIERMFGWMMPRGAERTTLSKMNMAGLGTKMIKFIMKSKNVSPLSELVDKARAAGVRMVACSMSMDLMGIKKEELLEGIEEGGVATYLNQAEEAGVNLFI
ncbi:MAG: FAD-dependent oxidoreductase [Planctomycetaceae bacterium]|nr:FAD-dependent oxidoreductase [Planctomycetaceae bacterium]